MRAAGESGSGPVLVCDRLTKVFGPGRPAVDGAALRVGPGETFALVGESGSGKTTLARMTARLLQPTAGRVLVAGVDVWHLRGEALASFRRQVQMVFQDPGAALDPRQTVGAAIEEPLLLHRWGGVAERRRQVGRLLELVGLRGDEARRFPHQLSGGQKQRVFVARALALSPRLVILDEPVSALDVSVRAQVLNLLLGLQRELGLTYFLVSHDLGVVRRVADRAAVMHRGRIVESGPVEAIWSEPAHPYTRALLEAVPVPDPARRPPAPVQPPPEFTDAPRGNWARSCLYEADCPRAERACAHRRPPEVALEDGRVVVCHFPQGRSPGGG